MIVTTSASNDPALFSRRVHCALSISLMVHRPNTPYRTILPVALALAVTGCRGADLAAIGDLPPGTYVAILAYADDTFVGSSGLTRVDSNGRVAIALDAVDDPERYVVYAYDFDAIDRLHGRPAEADLATIPVALAGTNGPRLPAPAFVGGFVPGDPVSQVAVAPDLTVSWLPDCPALLGFDEIGHANESCRPLVCGTVARQSGCTLDVETPLCAGGRLRGFVRGDGTVDFEPSVQFGACVSRATRYDAALSFECQGGFFEGSVCPIDVYSRAPPLAFEMMTRSTGDAEPIVGAQGVGGPRHLGGMALLDGDVVVTRFERPVNDLACRGVDTELLFFDHDSLLQTQGVPTLDCLRWLRRVPGADEVVGVYNDGDVGLARIDAAGEVVRTATITLGPNEFPNDVAVDPGQNRVVLLVTGVGDTPGYAMVFELDDLSFVERTADLGRTPRAATILSGGVIASIDSDLEIVYLAQGQSIAAYDMRTQCGKGSARDIIRHPATSRILVSMRTEVHAIFSLDPEGDGTCRRFGLFEEVAEPQALALWPNDPDLVLAAFDGTEESGHDRTFLAFAHVAESRMLPGVAEIGVGPVAELEVTRDGVVFALLAWSDRIVRAVYRP